MTAPDWLSTINTPGWYVAMTACASSLTIFVLMMTGAW